MIRSAAHRRAAAPTAELIAAIRGMVGSRKHNVDVSHLETLTTSWCMVRTSRFRSVAHFR